MNPNRAIRVLYVEDDPPAAVLVREMLADASASCRLEFARTLAEAAARLADGDIDLVLLDLRLPDGQGVDALSRLQEVAPDLPIVVFSGLADERAAMEAVRAGAQDYVVKGRVNGNALLRILRHSIERQRLAQALQIATAEAQQAEQALAAKHDFLQRIIDSAHDPIIVSDLKCRITLFNQAARDTFGEAAIRLGARRCNHKEHSGDSDCWQQWQDGPLKRVLSSGEPVRSVHSFDAGKGKRAFEVMISPLRDVNGELQGAVESYRDITERQQFQQQLRDSEEKLRHQAYHDPLTGLPNRTLLCERLAQSMANAHRYDYQLALIFIDLDRFKQVNDSLGIDSGDRLLQAISTRLKSTVRRGDTLARIGNDEFGIVLEHLTDEGGASCAADHYLQVLSQPLTLNGQECYPTASIGISLYPRDADGLEELLKNADTALLRAKAEGHNGFRFFTKEMQGPTGTHLQLEGSLRRALERQELFVEYQPQFDLQGRGMIGMEALVRWNHPERGRISPAEFIPLAEETGLIIPLGEWVLETACQQAVAWRQAGYRHLRMSVNLSPRQFRQHDLAKRVAAILTATGLPPSLLELEITESSIMHDLEAALTAMHAISDLGVKLAIDDFGLGYSSLSCLKRFPISRLKIDQSFVRDLSNDPNDAAITNAIIALGHSLKLEVIAEGVESDDQLLFLQRNGCAQGQGYYFSRPVHPDELAPLLRLESLFSDSIATN